jgi:hypothetical protein
MRASRFVSCILDVINCNQFRYILYVSPCYWVIVYRRFRINLHTHLHGTKYYLIFRQMGMILLGCYEMSSTFNQVTRRSKFSTISCHTASQLLPTTVLLCH